jgi:hypothetical protein
MDERSETCCPEAPFIAPRSDIWNNKEISGYRNKGVDRRYDEV